MRFRYLIIVTGLAWLAGWVSHAYVTHGFRHGSIETGGAPIVAASPSPAQESSVQEDLPIYESSTQSSAIGSNALELFQMTLQQGYFIKALNAWPVSRHEQARGLVFSYSHDLQRGDREQDALRLWKAYRDRFPEDGEAGIQQADVLHHEKYFQRETFLLMDVLHKTAGVESVHQVKARLQRAIDAATQRLAQSQHYGDLLRFYRRLSSLDGGNPGYMLMQAKALIEMGSLSQASAMLQQLRFDSEVGGTAKALLDKINGIETARYQVVIPVRRLGEHFLAPVSINGGSPLQLMIDTGSSITLVHASQGGMPENSGGARHSIMLRTASGDMKVPVFMASTLGLGGFDVHDVKLGVLPEHVVDHADGILGMDVLKHFDFLIDQRVPELKLSWRGDDKMSHGE